MPVHFGKRLNGAKPDKASAGQGPVQADRGRPGPKGNEPYLTRLSGVSPPNPCIRFLAAVMAIFKRVAHVGLPMRGIMMALFSLKSIS